ncbi:sigma-70 family RNA polymerase sigma factor [Actinomadura sp. 7K507]|uniref:sigma-70 family RNA polymerase sigma factor n=1 Tax=Actinomadura sp. 7K507 TaxID=2530365 RepID=UPI00104E5B8C|nr:sigma-70 family RNA polymerase sigma factor [Actinomadura sp. 7K507]TDC98376.1 sigma-70 family RNA polymerase sigma factor [Actinomadura sp. 7K507]
MDSQAELAQQFDRSRKHLSAVAFRMLGSVHEADDAVQEVWLRASRSYSSEVISVPGWLTTIAGRVCLDMLRSRRRRGEEFTDTVTLAELGPEDRRAGAANPEDEAMLIESVGLAMIVVLDELGPAERVAFVLHDLFGVPFAEIGEIVERSPTAAMKLASRARHRVRGTAKVPAADLARQRKVVAAFLAASRAGDLRALLAVLAPDVTRRADHSVLRAGAEPVINGAGRVAEDALFYYTLAQSAHLALVNGGVGVVIAPRGRLLAVIELAIDGDHITELDIIGDQARLREVEVNCPEFGEDSPE